MTPSPIKSVLVVDDSRVARMLNRPSFTALVKQVDQYLAGLHGN